MIRKPTPEEIANLFPLYARGWESQEEEHEYWFEEGDIEGEIPLQLSGTFLRNGPGLTEVYGTPLNHPIDGDGLVCAVSFSNGKAHFRSKYVQTATHVAEAQAQRMLFPGQMGSKPPPGGKKRFRDPSHTNVFYWGNKVLSCHEYSLPHLLDPATLETVGQDTLGGTLNLRKMSAHFRLDPALDRLVAVAFKPGVDFLKMKPQVCLYEYDRSWSLTSKTQVSIPGLNYVHDFALTPDWYVLHMTPFVRTSKDVIMEMTRGKTPGELLRYYPEQPSRMVLVQRFARNPRIVQLDTEPCHIYHFGTCYQSPCGDRVTFNACCLPVGFTMEWQYKVFLGNNGDAPGVMYQYTFSGLRGGDPKLERAVVEETRLRSCEFPFTNPYRGCVRGGEAEAPRYFYLMAGEEGVPLPFTDIVKHDLRRERSDCWHSNGVVGEPVFVARLGESSAVAGDEDDGWIITQLYIPEVHRTEFVILDACAVHKGPVCRLKLRGHLPISFHGTFTPHLFVHPRPSLPGDKSNARL